MTQSLSWNLHGNDQLSGVLERLDRTISGLSRKMDSAAGQAREYGRAIGSAESPSNRFHGTLQATGGHLDGLTSKLATAGAAFARMSAIAATAAVAAGGAVALFGTRAAMANEEAMVSFELMLGSAEKAAEFLQKLKDFNKATPFEMPQLRDAASRLLAVGTAASDVIPLLETLGDASAGMGKGAEGIERAVVALTQMKQKGQVTGEEMMQLTEAGIPAWEALAAVLGTDVADAMDKVTKRQVDVGKIFQAIETKAGPSLQRLTGMMERQSKTLTGRLSNLSDTVRDTMEAAFTPALPALEKFVAGATAMVPAAVDKLKSMAGQIGAIFSGSDVPERVMNSLRELGAKVLPALQSGWDKVVTTISNNREGLEKLGRFISDVAIPLFGTSLVSSIELITAAFQAIIWVAARVVDAIKFFTEIFLINLGFIIHSAENTFGWIPELGPKLHAAADAFDQFARSVMDKLNALDGRTVDINVAYHEYRAGERYSPTNGASYTSGGQFQEFAEGGMVQGPPGSAQIVKAHAGERVLTPEQQRDSGNLGTIEVILKYPDGYVVHQELLAHKRRRGLSSLGLA